jgi:hypothetical protein
MQGPSAGLAPPGDFKGIFAPPPPLSAGGKEGAIGLIFALMLAGRIL